MLLRLRHPPLDANVVESGRLDAELNLAECIMADGEYTEAVRRMRRVLQRREQTLRHDDRRMLETKSVLAWALSTQPRKDDMWS
jgi:hypothetical protein